MTPEYCEPDDWEIEYYVLSACELLEVMKEAGILEGPSDLVTLDGHHRLMDAYARGWKPKRLWLFHTVINFLEGGNKESWPQGCKDGIVAWVDDYLTVIFPNPENN